MSTLVPFPAWFVSRQPQQDTGFEVPLLFSSFQLTDSKAFNSNYTFGIGTKNYWLIDETTHALQVDPYSFTPNKRRDPDGMSFYREDFTTQEEVALDNPPAAGARVARVTVKFLIELGLGEIVTD